MSRIFAFRFSSSRSPPAPTFHGNGIAPPKRRTGNPGRPRTGKPPPHRFDQGKNRDPSRENPIRHHLNLGQVKSDSWSSAIGFRSVVDRFVCSAGLLEAQFSVVAPDLVCRSDQGQREKLIRPVGLNRRLNWAKKHLEPERQVRLMRTGTVFGFALRLQQVDRS